MGILLRGNLDEDEIGRMAAGYNKTSAQLLLRWNVQQGIIPIPKSKNKERLLQNISISDFEITEEDMKRMNAMNQNKRTSYDPMVFDFLEKSAYFQVKLEINKKKKLKCRKNAGK